MMLARDLRGRRHARDRNRTLRAVDIGQGTGVIVTVDDKLGAILGEDRAQPAAVHKALEIAARTAARGMMDENDTKQPFTAAACQ